MSSYRGSRVLVTGGCGAIGSNLVGALVERGAILTVMDDLSSSPEWNLSEVINKITFKQQSITDQAAVHAAFTRGFDIVFHLATFFANQNSIEHPLRDLEVNGYGTLLILKASHEANVRRVVYTTSSHAAYLHNKGTLHEKKATFGASTPYQATKNLGEMYCEHFRSYYDMDVPVIRLSNSYGPGECPGPYRGVVANFVWESMHGCPMPITGSGKEERDFTYVEDIVQGLLLVGSCSCSYPVLNLASGDETTIEQLAGTIGRVTGVSDVVYKERRRWDRTENSNVSLRRIRRLGYVPQVGLAEGIAITWEWMRKHEDEIAAYLRV